MEGHLINLDTSVRQFKALFEGRLTAARAGKLDRLDTTISSRASATGQSTTHGKLNTNKAAIDGVRSVANGIKAKTDLLKPNPPTGGRAAFLRWSSSNVMTVTGAGVLRNCTVMRLDYGAAIGLMVDGKWLTSSQLSATAELGSRAWSGSGASSYPGGDGINIAEGGIRFASYFKIYVGGTAGGYLFYNYTLGD